MESPRQELKYKQIIGEDDPWQHIRQRDESVSSQKERLTEVGLYNTSPLFAPSLRNFSSLILL